MSNDQATQETPRIRVGCAGLPPRMPRERYFRDLSFLESDVMHRAPPRRAAVRAWRDAAPDEAGFSLLAWQALTHAAGKKGYAFKGRDLGPAELAETGGLRDTPTIRSGVDAMREAAELLRAEAVVFRTPASFTPSAKNRDAMKRFFGDIAPAGAFGGAWRVWEPEGLWGAEEAVRFSAELGVVLACDPLARDPLEEQLPVLATELPRDAAYFRIRGLGSADQQLDGGELEALAEFIEDFERVWVAFGNVGKFSDARRFARALGAAPDEQG